MRDCTESFYDFRIHGENRGYSYLRLEPERLYSLTRFRLDDGAVFTNVFRLTLKGDRVLACRHGESPWVDLRTHPPDHYPGCAYPLLLSKARTEPFAYVQVSEDDGTVAERPVLETVGPAIVETVRGQVVRRFELCGSACVRINWGGAISTLRDRRGGGCRQRDRVRGLTSDRRIRCSWKATGDTRLRADHPAAVAWLARTPYTGSIPARLGVRGLRARVGNMQIGTDRIFEHLFEEPRFNGWCVGEVHILDSRIVPNGRRDYFEPSPHLRNLENQLGAIAQTLPPDSALELIETILHQLTELHADDPKTH